MIFLFLICFPFYSIIYLLKEGDIIVGIVDLEQLLKTMKPVLGQTHYVFCSVEGRYGDHQSLNPIASFQEREGLTLILEQDEAKAASLTYESVFRKITLSVHSSLQAVGLTAAVAECLASHGISANVVAAYYHDHVFVPQERAEEALALLQGFSK